MVAQDGSPGPALWYGAYGKGGEHHRGRAEDPREAGDEIQQGGDKQAVGHGVFSLAVGGWRVSGYKEVIGTMEGNL